MATVKVTKQVATLPVTLEPDTIYMVRVDTGFDMYVSDMTGTVAHPLNSSSPFLSDPDQVDDSDETYFYWGWSSVNGNWLVRRTKRSDASKTNATITNNAGFVDLTDAWSNRTTLTYS